MTYKLCSNRILIINFVFDHRGWKRIQKWTNIFYHILYDLNKELLLDIVWSDIECMSFCILSFDAVALPEASLISILSSKIDFVTKYQHIQCSCMYIFIVIVNSNWTSSQIKVKTKVFKKKIWQKYFMTANLK